MMASRAKEYLIHAGSFLIAGVLLWLALRGVEFEAITAALLHANWWWLPPVVIVTLLSHWLRALRWSLFLDVTTDKEGQLPEQAVSRTNTFVSVMVGYMANYAGPRLGEIIRTANVARSEKRPFSTVLGTVVVERIVDMVTFGVLLLTVPLVFSNQMGALWALLSAPISEWLAGSSTGLLLILALGAAAGSLVGLWFLIRGINRPSSRLAGLAERFREGILSVIRTGHPWKVVSFTLLIWVCYGLMAWIPFIMLGQHDLYGIGPFAGWGLMLIGAFGVIIPSPGGIGTYHFITIQTLGLLFGMPQTEAATYALLTHTGQMLLYIGVGFIGLLFMGASLTTSTPPNES